MSYNIFMLYHYGNVIVYVIVYDVNNSLTYNVVKIIYY
jgi:hypothetical protein